MKHTPNPDLLTPVLARSEATPSILSRTAVFVIAFFGGLPATLGALVYNAHRLGDVQEQRRLLAVGLVVLAVLNVANAWVLLDGLAIARPIGLFIHPIEGLDPMMMRYYRWGSRSVQFIASLALMWRYMPIWRVAESTGATPLSPWARGFALVFGAGLVNAVYYFAISNAYIALR